MDWGKLFQVTNKSGRILISGVVTLPDQSVTVIEPSRYPERLVRDLQIFEKRGFVDVTNEISVAPKAKKDSFVSVKNIEDESGKTKGIVVTPLDTSGKSIEVVGETPVAPEKPVVEEAPKAKEEKMTREQAIELLNSHWKKVESEVNKITDARKLNLLQVVAQEEGVANKKKEIIEARLQEI